MKTLPFLQLFAIASLSAAPLAAEKTRQLDAHEHGVAQLDIAFDGKQIAMELHAPGADIVGFEYAPSRAEDRAAVDAAVAALASPLALFQFPEAAACSVTQASARLEAEEEHDDHEDHGHEDHDHDDHDHDDHDDHDDHEDHDEDDHAEDVHDEDHKEGDHADHDDDDHKDEDHAEDAHDDHEDETGHTEFHAEYLLTCANPAAANTIAFAYFEAFPNAREVEVQVLSATGAKSFEVPKDAPLLDLGGMF